MLKTVFRRITIALGLACLPAVPSASQTALDRSDPALIEEEARQHEPAPQANSAPPTIERPGRPLSELTEPVLLGAVRIDGLAELRAADFAPVIDRYVGQELSPSELRALASDIANVARARGFGLASAWIPPQRVTGGVLRVRLDEGRIDGIEASGDAAAVVERTLMPLIGSGPVSTAELERRLLLAGDIAGVRIGKPRLDRRAGSNILVLSTARDRVQAQAYLDNWGTSPVGPVRARATLNFNGFAAGDDRLTLAAVVTPVSPEEFALVRAAYSRAIGSNGTEAKIGGYIAQSRPGGSLSGRGIEGRSSEAQLGLAHPFVRSRAASLWGELELTLRDAEQDRRGVRVRDDRLTTLTASGYTVAKLGDGRGRGRLAFVQGLDMLDATDSGDDLASRSDGSGRFSKLYAWGQYDRPLGKRVSLHLQAEGQLASRPLLSSEEMGLGGRYFLRGYDYREFSGDKGVAGSAELRFDLKSAPRPFKGAQLYAYADAGSVGNYRGGSGGGSLASAGGGIRASIGKFEAGVELGVPLSKGFAGSDHDPRFSFTLGARF